MLAAEVWHPLRRRLGGSMEHSYGHRDRLGGPALRQRPQQRTVL